MRSKFMKHTANMQKWAAANGITAIKYKYIHCFALQCPEITGESEFPRLHETVYAAYLQIAAQSGNVCVLNQIRAYFIFINNFKLSSLWGGGGGFVEKNNV